MTKRITSLFMMLLMAVTTAMASGDSWHLYFYSEANGIDGDAGLFAATDNSDVFQLKNCRIPVKGINFGVHNSDWSIIYGWKEASVDATDTEVELEVAKAASGWLDLPEGLYDVTFNAARHTISFAVHEQGEGTYYLRGGDISMLNYVEDMGARFYTAEGVQQDPIAILKENGVNIVRLRLYNNPGVTVTYTPSGGKQQSYALPANYLDENDVLKLARRAKDAGMQIELTFHYSDFWTNGEMQFKPKGWENLSMADLQNAVHDYTYDFLQKMNAQGTTPEYVSLGNEIQSGLLFGFYNKLDNVNGYATNQNMGNVAALLAQGSKAVRSACPNSKIIIHLTLSTNITEGNYTWFFDAMKKNSLDYDIVGASYYPFWTNKRPDMLNSLANTMYARYGKDLMVMEVGYSWTPYRPKGRYGGEYWGQLGLNGTAYNEASQGGQKAFIEELQTVVKGNEHILGYLYWDPVMVEQQVNGSWIKTGWVAGGENQVGNTTWFDYTGKALPVLDAIAEDAGKKELSVNSVRQKSASPLIHNLQGQVMGTSWESLPAGLYIRDGKKVVRQ